MTLVSCSPLFNVDKPDTDDALDGDSSPAATETEAAAFTAEARVSHVKHVFRKHCDLEVKDWAKCVLADNAPVNQKTARDLDLPSIGCKSHLLNLEANAVIANDNQLEGLLDDVWQDMTTWKNSNKNSSVVRELTHFRPTIPSRTRWSGNWQMLDKWGKTKSALIEASEHDNATIDIDASAATNNRAKKSNAMHRNHRGHDLQRCKMGRRCIRQGAAIPTDPDFESGVIKLQEGKVNELTEEEREALQSLRKEDQANVPGSPEPITMPEKIAKRKRDDAERVGSDERVNVSWVLGSAAEVERLWSAAKHIPTDAQRQMDPAMFETIIFFESQS